MVVVRGISPDARPRPVSPGRDERGIFQVEPGGQFDLHYHDCDEYWLIFAGRARVPGGFGHLHRGARRHRLHPDWDRARCRRRAQTLEGSGSRLGRRRARPGHSSDPEAAQGHDVPCSRDESGSSSSVARTRPEGLRRLRMANVVAIELDTKAPVVPRPAPRGRGRRDPRRRRRPRRAGHRPRSRSART